MAVLGSVSSLARVAQELAVRPVSARVPLGVVRPAPPRVPLGVVRSVPAQARRVPVPEPAHRLTAAGPLIAPAAGDECPLGSARSDLVFKRMIGRRPTNIVQQAGMEEAADDERVRRVEESVPAR